MVHTDSFIASTLVVSKYVMIILSCAIIIRSIRSMLSENYEPEIWAYIRSGKDMLPVKHWENIIGSARSADIRVKAHGIKRVHGILKRNDKGQWAIYDVFSKGGIIVNDTPVDKRGLIVENGDIIILNGIYVRFHDITTEKRRRLEEYRTAAGSRVLPTVTMSELTVFEIFLLLQHALVGNQKYLKIIALGFAALIVIEWCCFFVMRFLGRSGFEVEILAFYLTSIGLSVTASSAPGDIYRQILIIIISVVMFLFFGIWLRNLRLCSSMRTVFGLFALGLLALNVLTSEEIFGARNWLEIGGFSFQPSELVKVAFVYVGAATLDRLYRKKNLYSFVVFSAICVIALALMGDFGTAVVFFAAFLVISFMRSGSIATVILALTGAGLAGFLAISVKPHIARRFSTWGHIWEDVYNTGYQQTRALSAGAAGGLFGKGAGAGWFKNIVAANTDLVFSVMCEELGLIIAILSVIAVLVLAFFAMRSARHGRSAFYSIAACSAMSLLMVQLSLNVFGSLDILPFTGVTFPFVSKGGTSLISSWMMMAYVKSADNRKSASFAVKSVKTINNGVADMSEDELDEEVPDDFDIEREPCAAPEFEETSDMPLYYNIQHEPYGRVPVYEEEDENE